MNINEFRIDLLETVRSIAQSQGDSFLSSFVAQAGVRLTDAEEFADFQVCHFEGEGSRRRKLSVDGYAFDEADNSMSLIIASFSGEDSTPPIGVTEVKRHFGMLRAYVEEALSGKLTDEGELSIEESEPGYGLACDLRACRGDLDRFRLYLVTDSELAMRARDLPEEELDGVPVEFHVWDIARFHRAHESATGRDDLEVEFSGNGGGLQFLKAGGTLGEYEAYLCMIPGKVLAEIYDRYGSRLLEGNIRSFLSLKGDVNKKIRNTILNKPSMFFAYNNGISATAEAVEIRQGKTGPEIVSATNLQIVNGGQTTASLALAFRDGKTDLSSIHVQMKLSVLPPEKASEFIPDIARFANSQNKVNDADFFSNHPYHVRLEELSRRLWAPTIGGAQHQTHWFYERARGQYMNEQSKMSKPEKNRFLLQNPRTQVLTKTDVAKLENTWRCIPHKVSLGSQKNFRGFAEWISQRWENDSAAFNEEYFRKLIALAILFERTGKYVSEQSWYQAGGYRANLVTYTLSKLKQMVDDQGRNSMIDLRRIWDRQSVPEELICQIGIISKEISEVLTAPDRAKENVTEWAKMAACWTRVNDLDIELSKEVHVKLINSAEVNSTQRQAKVQQLQDDGIGTQMRVVSMGGLRWQQVRKWADEQRLLTPMESSLLASASAIPKKIPNEKTCSQLGNLYARLVEEGLPE